MVILNAYLPPRGSYSNDDFRQEVDQLHEICSKYQGRPIILAGDLNIDINKPHDSRTKYLVNFMKTHSLREPVPIIEPTFHHNNGMGSSSKIDYILVNDVLRNANQNIEYRILNDDAINTSSHKALYIKLDLTFQPPRPDIRRKP